MKNSLARPLRDWQRRAIAHYVARWPADWLLEATPGAGKTVVAVDLARAWLSTGRVAWVLIVCPTTHLRRQWADAAAARGLHLDPTWPTGAVLAPDVQGAVITYQQLAQAPEWIAACCRAQPAGVVLDEIHHAGDQLTWGTALTMAVGSARHRLALSGTPFRSDAARIPYVRYRDGVSQPDFQYGYAAALRDGIVRPLAFQVYAGRVTWQIGDQAQTAMLSEPAAEARRRQRLRAAVEAPTWITAVLRAAHHQLERVRQAVPDAGGLVVARSQAHAQTLASHLATLTGAPVPVAISDDPTAQATLRAFAQADTPWLVAVNMVSEGVDLPRLAVGVYATTIQTELYFRQFCGRFVRVQPGGPRGAWVYLPRDPVLVAHARALRTERQHALPEFRPADAVDQPADESAMPRRPRPFQALAGTAWADGTLLLTASPPAPPPLSSPGLVPATAGGSTPSDSAASPARYAQKAALRRLHHRLVGRVAWRTGLAPRVIHAELIARFGHALQDATLDELQARLALLRDWLEHGLRLDIPVSTHHVSQ
ncbi:DEAD/DEAH box helicase [Nitrospira sp. Kam-Ns4a]